MHKVLLSLLTLLFLSGCGPRYGDFFPYHDNGIVKPRVVMLPIKDGAGKGDLAEELMQCIHYQLMDRGDLYVYPEDTVNRQLMKMGNVSFFSPDISFSRQFGGADFLVATELVECRTDLFGNVEKECMPPHLQRKNILMIKLRVRVIDLRCSEPVIVLQEIMTRNLLIPNRKIDDCEVDVSCFREVSSRLALDFVQRLEEVTWSLR